MKFELEYPKVLLVTSTVFNPYTGGGVLLRNLFKGWPIERIAMIYNDFFPIDKSVCQYFYKLGPKEIKWIWPISTIRKKLLRRELAVPDAESPHHTSFKRISPLRMKAKIAYDQINKLLGSDGVHCRTVVSDDLLEWIKDFQPDIIYCHIGSLMNIHFVQELKRFLNIPICIHIMDDWLGAKCDSGLLGPILRNYYVREFKKLLGNTTLRMGIGEKMCDAYEQRYGYSFVPFANAVDPSTWLRNRTRKNITKAFFQITYAGTINSKNAKNLKGLSKVIESISNRGADIKLQIYTFPPLVNVYRPKLEHRPNVIVEEVPDNDKDMAELLSSADLLFLPIDFTKVSIRRMRYSIFAKIPTYMLSGTPVLVYGPSEIASVEYAQKEGWAYVVSQKDLNVLKEAILRLMSDTGLRQTLARRAQEVAIRDFDVQRIRKKFRKELARAAFGEN